MSSSSKQFSPKQIAESLQVSESSVKRWCDRGKIPTVRTLGGHRRITLDGLRHFLRETKRSLVAPETLGLDSSLLQLVSAPTGPRPVQIAGRGHEPVQSEFRSSLAEGKEERCLEILNQRVAQGFTRAEACEDLISEAMHALGDAWDCGQLDVYQERRSCTICTRLIHALRSQVGAPGDDAPIAIGAAPAGDPYQLPSSLVELAFRELGWHAVNLGNDLPLESLMQAVVDYQPKVVWLSVSAVSDQEQLVRDQNRLADSLPPGVSMIVGGQGLAEQLRPRLRYTAHLDSLRHLVELASVLYSK